MSEHINHDRLVDSIAAAIDDKLPGVTATRQALLAERIATDIERDMDAPKAALKRPGIDTPIRMWVADSHDGLGADIWIEGENGSRLGGDRTLVWKNVRWDWARPLVQAWNTEADRQGGSDA